MRNRILSSVFLLGLVMASFPVFAGGVADSMKVDGAYIRAVPPGQPNSAAFMMIKSRSDQGHALVSAESDIAMLVELHTHINDNGMMRMRKVEKIDLPAGEMVKLEPGGLHVMLINLQKKLVPGEEASITLVFEDGSKQEITVPIKKMQMTMMKHDMKNMKH